MTRFLPLFLFALIFSGLAFGSQSKNDYRVDKTSPDGTYRVTVDVQVIEEGDILAHFREQGTIRVFKGDQVVYAHDWKRRDNSESTFRDDSPVIEWISDSVLRMGKDVSTESQKDEVIIWNNTREPLKQVGISCSKYEDFNVFDMASGSRIILHPSQRLNRDASGIYGLGYGGEAQNGKRFEGVLRQKQTNRPLTFRITIRKKDLGLADKLSSK